MEYEFSVDWFSHVAPIWSNALPQLLPGPAKILEVGSYEGRSTVWIMEHAFAANLAGNLYCVDTWEGGIEHDRAAMPQVEGRFERNIAKATSAFPWVRVHKIKSASRLALAKLIADGHRSTFDLAYIDGSHLAADVLGDLVLAFDLCRIGGIIVCDDYLWGLAGSPLLAPKIGIDAFVNCFIQKAHPIIGIPLYQLWLKKIAD